MTRSLMLSTLLAACACSHDPVRSGSPTSTSEDIRSLLALEEELFRAIQARDRAALTELLAEDFVFRGPGEVELDRVAFLDTLTSLPGPSCRSRGRK